MSTFLNVMSKVLHHVQWGKHASQEHYVEPKVDIRIALAISDMKKKSSDVIRKNNISAFLLIFVDFNDATSSPQSCGYDENTGEDKICCEDYGGIPVIGSQPPKFPSKNLKARPCLDHTKQCTKWVQKYPESCKPGHESYIFMREACQESCGRCKNDVIFYHEGGIS